MDSGVIAEYPSPSELLYKKCMELVSVPPTSDCHRAPCCGCCCNLLNRSEVLDWLRGHLVYGCDHHRYGCRNASFRASKMETSKGGCVERTLSIRWVRAFCGNDGSVLRNCLLDVGPSTLARNSHVSRTRALFRFGARRHRTHPKTAQLRLHAAPVASSEGTRLS